MTPTGLGGDLSASTILVVILAVILGGLGGLAHYEATREPNEKWWQSLVVGIVASLGTLAFASPITTISDLGKLVLAGFFGRGVLAVLQSRVTSAVEAERKNQAVKVAGDAIAEVKARRAAAPAAAMANPGAPDVAAIQLESRLAQIR